MDFQEAYAEDKNAATKGKWMVTQAGFDVKVAKMGNPVYMAELTRLQKPHLAALRSSADTSELLDSIIIQAMSTHILFDWKAESNGKPIKYTPKLGAQYLTEYPEFREDISELALSRANFKPEVIGKK